SSRFPPHRSPPARETSLRRRRTAADATTPTRDRPLQGRYPSDRAPHHARILAAPTITDKQGVPLTCTVRDERPSGKAALRCHLNDRSSGRRHVTSNRFRHRALGKRPAAVFGIDGKRLTDFVAR